MEERRVDGKFLQMPMLEGVSKRLGGARRHTTIVASNFWRCWSSFLPPFRLLFFLPPAWSLFYPHALAHPSLYYRLPVSYKSLNSWVETKILLPRSFRRFWDQSSMLSYESPPFTPLHRTLHSLLGMQHSALWCPFYLSIAFLRWAEWNIFVFCFLGSSSLEPRMMMIVAELKNLIRNVIFVIFYSNVLENLRTQELHQMQNITVYRLQVHKIVCQSKNVFGIRMNISISCKQMLRCFKYVLIFLIALQI